MIVRGILSIGFPGAQQEEELEIDDEDLKGLSDDEKDVFILKQVDEWAAQLVDTWYEEIDDDD